MKTPRDADSLPTVLGPKVERKPAAPLPNGGWKPVPAHPQWVQDQATRAVKRSDQ